MFPGREALAVLLPMATAVVALWMAACGGSSGGGDDFWDADGASDADADADTDSDGDTDTSTWSGPAAFADEVVDAPGATGEGSGDANNAVNGVRGGGQFAGGTDVFSLGCEVGVDNTIVLGWSGTRFWDGPGADLAVFENAFEYQGANFMDQVIVEVSADGESWVALPHDYVHADETVYSTDPLMWPGFAGVTPVLLHEEDNPVDPFDPALAGGDHFDLADLPAEDPVTQQIMASGGLHVRLVTAPSRTNPDTGEPYLRDAISNGADIDGVYARYLTED
ncbi:MAG TPA: LIC_13355 family lipoprotein [Polyangia bacterium]|nr:LIC_13355 family lipoprotein [Polyangia bacterium]